MPKKWDVFRRSQNSFSLTFRRSFADAVLEAAQIKLPTAIIDPRTRKVRALINCTSEEIAAALTRYYPGWSLEDME